MTEKRCCPCGRVQPASEFNRRVSSKDGLQARCRDCSRAWYQQNMVLHAANARRIATQNRRLYRERLARITA